MPKTLSAPLTFYPAYCFALSPTHNTWARLTAADVHALKERAGFEGMSPIFLRCWHLQEGALSTQPNALRSHFSLGQNLYFHLNHPIKWIRLVGVIIAVDIYPTRWIMSLDDSSGATIEITCGRQKPVQSALPAQHASTASFPNAPTEGHTATGVRIDLRGIDIGSVVKLKGGIGSFRGEKQILLERVSKICTTNEEAAAWAENTKFRRSVLDIPWVVGIKDEKRARSKAEGLDREQRAKEERRKKRTFETIGTKKSTNGERRLSTAGREKQRDKEASLANAENGIQETAKIKRAQEKESREQEFKRLEARKEQRKPDMDVALRKERVQLEEAQQAILEVKMPSYREDPGLAAESEKKERAKSKRDEDRKLRVQEFERLMRGKEIENNERSDIAE